MSLGTRRRPRVARNPADDGWPRLRFGLVGALFLMQLGLAVVLETLPSFLWLGAYFFFVPWDRLRRFIEPQAATDPPR